MRRPAIVQSRRARQLSLDGTVQKHVGADKASGPIPKIAGGRAREREAER